MSETVPLSADPERRRLHPLSLLVRFFEGMGGLIFAIPAVIAFSGAQRNGWLILGLIPILLIGLGIQVAVKLLGWSRFTYVVGEREVVIEGGILSRFRRSIPYARIQDVSLDRGPISRLLGLAKVRIETGGGAKDEGVLDSVTLDEAERVKAAIRAAKARLEGVEAPAAEAQASAPPPADDGRVLFQMGPGRVLTQGLFSFSLAWLVVIGFAFELLGPGFGFGADYLERWIREILGVATETAAGIARASRWALAALVIVGLVVTIVGGVIFGVVRTFLANHGFRLSANADRFLCERGLLTLRQTAAAKPRIQLARIDGGLIARRFGWWSLTLQSLSGATGDGGHLNIAPFAKLPEISAILEDQPPLGTERTEPFERPPPASVYKSLVIAAGIAVGIGVIVWFSPRGAPALILPVVVAVISWIRWRAHGFALSGDVIFLRKGVWPQRIWIIPLARIETVSLRQGLIQRPFGLATLNIDTAGASALLPTSIENLRLARAREIIAAIRLGRPGVPASPPASP